MYTTVDGFNYGVEGEEVWITGYTGSGGNITIPSIIDGYQVVIIDDSVFMNNSTIITLNIPNSIKEISLDAFTNCRNLVNINIPSSLVSVGPYPFNSCHSLISINVDSNNLNYSSVDGVLYDKLQSY